MMKPQFLNTSTRTLMAKTTESKVKYCNRYNTVNRFVLLAYRAQNDKEQENISFLLYHFRNYIRL